MFCVTNDSIDPGNLTHEMQRYSGFPTPPSTSEDSPGSVHVLSSPLSYVSDNSTSPVHFTQPVMFIPTNFNVLPSKTFNNLRLTDMDITEIPPCLKVMEQPIDKFRFRYKSEMTGTHGSLNGENSDKTRKMTYPTVELCNYEGSAVVRCSIWQINHHGDDFMPHAHRLVKKKHGKEEADDPHDLKVDKDSNYQATFHSMGIIHTAKKNIVGELIKKKTKLKREAVSREGRKDLNKKEELEIKGLAEAESKSINLNVVCLRFDAFYVGGNDVYFPLCPPVFSHAINNLKSALTGELKIVRLDHCTSPANGNREIFLLVERVTKKNIRVRFYELDEDDNLIWEDYGKFNDLDVHHQYAIVLRTPPYRNRDITAQVKVCVELVRPSDNARSDPKEFTYTPTPNHGRPGSKRSRPNEFDSKDYDTTSIGSENLPLTILGMSNDFDIIDIEENVNSNELYRALTNINSDEFLKLYKENQDEYQSAGLPNIENINNFSVDFPSRGNLRSNLISSNVIKPYTFSRKFQTIVQRVYQEISEYLKSNPKVEGVKESIKHYFLEGDQELNAFHMAVLINDIRAIKFFVKLIYSTRYFEVVNKPSAKLGTVLHLATLCNNLELITTLISSCNANISITNADMETPLHLAAAEGSLHLMETLLKAEDAIKFIDQENAHNDTALHIAVKKGNLQAAQVLCKYGADVNLRHPCNGHTSLRFAIENGDLEMVRFILYETKADPEMRDFTDINPIQAALHNNTIPKIRELIQKYMLENEMTCDEINIKEEIEDESSEDEMVIHEEEVKVEPLNLPDDLLVLYQNVTTFSDECLEEVSKELDTSGKWQDLADLLDVKHLLRMNTFNERKSPSKQLLNYVVASNEGSIKEIRDFLENLDEVRAVQAIDRMVQQMYGCAA